MPSHQPSASVPRLFRRLGRASAVADATGAPFDDALGQVRAAETAERALAQRRRDDLADLELALARGRLSRRAFLRGAGAAGIGSAALAALGPAQVLARPGLSPAAASQARVVIIGAGAAGIRAAHLLGKFGIASSVFEASGRIGGRTYSDTTTFPGVVIEHGGELISTEHSAVRNLIRNLGLHLEVVDGGALPEGSELYLVDGSLYTEAAASADWAAGVWKAFKDELQAAPWPQTFDAYTQRGAELDSISVLDWFDRANPNANAVLADLGPGSRLARLMATDTVTEYGADPDRQPALNLLYLLAWNSKSSISPLPGTDELYHTVEGSQAIVDRMVAELTMASIEVDRALVAIEGSLGGPYICHFDDGSSRTADHLVLTIPFAALREVAVDPRILDGVRPAKLRAITESPMGTNAKIEIELAHRTWGPGHDRLIDGVPYPTNGIGYSDPDGFQCLWDAHPVVPGDPGYLLYYPGGAHGASLHGNDLFGEPNPADVSKVLSWIEPLFPGTTAAYTGRAIQSFWAAEPWHHGAYSYWGIGHYTGFAGAEGLQEGNIHFAGEATSVEFQGYINGAVETGERVAREIKAQV
jgi:monoamine oxidase